MGIVTYNWGKGINYLLC